MKSILIPVFLISVSVSCSQIGYKPITGDLLSHWNTANSSCFPDVWDSDSIGLPNGINELVLTGIEVEQDSLDIYLLGISPETDIPFLLATGGYRGEYNFERFFVYYHKEEDEFEIKFLMPNCSRTCRAYYEWDPDNRSLIQLRSYTEDPSLEALARADSLLIEGEITEAIDKLNRIWHMYTRYYYDYYDPNEMIARLLRIVNRTALEKVDAGDFQGAVDLFGYLSDYNQMSFQWYMSFSDSLDFMESDRSSYMGLSEYVMILNNYAFFLEQTDALYLSQKILGKVLDLQPSRVIAHLNIADVLWKLGEYAEAEEHYSIYLEIMTEGNMTQEIPPYVQERINSMHAAPAHSVMVDILSEYSCPIEMTWDPIRIDSCQLMEPEGMRFFAGRTVWADGVRYVNEMWTIVTDTNGYPISCEETYLDNPILLSAYRFGDYDDMLWLIARTEQGDTLWTCALEGTGESDYSPDATELSDDGYLLAIYPDCWTSHTWTARISSAGEMIWHNGLTANYLLGLPEPLGEMKPHISSFRETSSGDILACGRVSEWATSPDISFICLLDGDTGDPLWKTINFGLGEALAYDAIETISGMIVAVGSTARSITPEDAPHRTTWGPKYPFIAVLDPAGTFQKLVICDLDMANMFYNIVETDPINNEFLIAGGDTLINELVLLRAIIPTDPEIWGNGPEYQVKLTDGEGNEYLRDDSGIYSQIGAVRTDEHNQSAGSAVPVSGMEFVTIPSGSFMMGSPSTESGRDNDEEQHRVSVGFFEFMTTEVTQGMWEEIMGNNPAHDYGVGDNYPVYYVSWNDCQDFTDRLNGMDPNHTYRLPSEAEWEYACRGGNTTCYYWGDSSSESVIGRYCRYIENSDSTAHSVGTKDPNDWGLYDMSGNVWEWCEDSYRSHYGDCPTDGSAYKKSGSDRVRRGGSWYSVTYYCRSANRHSFSPGNSGNSLGFRLVRVLRTPDQE